LKLIHALTKRVEFLKCLAAAWTAMCEQFDREVLIAQAINGRVRDAANGIHQELTEHHAQIFEKYARGNFHRSPLGFAAVSEKAQGKSVNGPDICLF
jgi:hypothetical protein